MMEPRDRYDSLIHYYAEHYGLSFSLIKAQMLAESNANPKAVSHAGAKGLAQFMPATFKEVADSGDDPFNPEHSIRAQCRYMRRLLDYFENDSTAALAAYNHGMGNVRNHRERYGRLCDEHLPEETREYLNQIAHKRGQIEGVVLHA